MHIYILYLFLICCGHFGKYVKIPFDSSGKYVVLQLELDPEL